MLLLCDFFFKTISQGAFFLTKKHNTKRSVGVFCGAGTTEWRFHSFQRANMICKPVLHSEHKQIKCVPRY